MRSRLALAILLTWATVAAAQAPAPPAPGLAPTPPPQLEEVDALRIGKLQAERQLLVEEYRRIQSEQAARDRAFQERGTVLNAAILEAAAKAKLDLKEGWRPDPERRVWVK